MLPRVPRAVPRVRPTGTTARVRRLAAGAVLLASVAAAMTAGPVPASAAGEQILLTFDQGGTLGEGAVVTDVSGNGNHGVVHTNFGGTILATNGIADFPDPCWQEPCPNAMIEVADSASLNPGTAAFEWGARIKLRKGETADGENVLQKGRWGDTGGQWKLQVDKTGGKPSCVVSGFSGGVEFRVLVKSSVGIANNVWRKVVCRRTADGVAILVDGVVRGSASMPLVDLSTSASVTIGAKEVEGKNNDQFLGKLDDVFMRLL